VSHIIDTPQLDRQWVEGAVSSDRRLRLTAEQLHELRDDFHALEEKWVKTSAEHSPGDGAEEVFLLMQAFRRAR